MPPHLHPRSTATSTLFAGTLLASFTVVAIPHLFPCPRPRRAYADAERPLDPQGRPVQRTRQRKAEAPETPPTPAGGSSSSSSSSSNATSPAARDKDRRIEEEAALFRQFEEEAKMLEKEARECPVPKPGGALGRLLGFPQDAKERDDMLERRKHSTSVR